MNDLLQQLIGMGPGIGAAAAGNGPAFASFMEGYQRAAARLQQQKRLGQQDSLALEDRQLALQDRESQRTRQQSADARAAEDQNWQNESRRLGMAGTLSQAAGGAESVPEGEAAIDTLFRVLSPEMQGQMAPARDAALMGVQRTVTGRQKKQVADYVEAALKTAFVADHPDSDPEMQLPEHMQRVMGKPSARLSELQSFAQLPVGKPAEKKVAPTAFNLSPGQTRFGGDGKPIASLPDRPKSNEPSLMQVSEIDPQSGELVTSLVPKTPGELSRKPRPTSEGERKAAAFYRQMESSIKTLDELEGKLTETELYQIQSLPQEALIGLANRNKLSENAKRYMRAFEQFTEARLRPVSGAAIADSEFARDRRTYARQFGETPALNADRRAARQTALDSLGEMAGAARPRESTTGPKPGERRKVKGVLAEWDGKGWVRVQM